jgi:fibronectin-binding autotransporter adhesin
MQINKLIRGSFNHFSSGALLVVSAFAVFGSSLRAATVTKADNTDNLNLGSSWVGGVRPAPVDILLWNSTVTGANTVSLGVPNLLIGTLRITNPGGLVTINGIGTLQLGANGIPGIGIDMSSATADLTINANIALEDSPIDSTWTVVEGRTLTITGNVSENGPANKILTIAGAGTTRITGIISDDKKDDLSLVKSGTGTLILAAANTYNGDTTVNQGVLRISNSAALGKATGTTIVNSGGELQLLGNISIAGREDVSLTGTGAGGPGSAAIRNISGGNQFNGSITLQDAAGVVRINSDSGSLALLGNITEDGTSDKILTFGGRGSIEVSGVIGGGDDIAVAKDGTGTLTLSGNNSFAGPATITGGEVILSGNGGISLLRRAAAAAGITVSNATLTLDNTLANKNDRIGNRDVTLNDGTFNFIHGATSANFTETIGGPLILNSGASTIRTDASAAGGSSVLTFNELVRIPGATVNFVGNPNSANNDNNIRFNLQASGPIGAWATVGGTAFATYSSGKASGTDSVEALAVYDQTVTRLSSGAKSIASNSINNVDIIDGTGPAGNLTLGAAATTIFTLSNSATGLNAPAGGVTIDPAGRTLQVNGILNATNASALTIGTGTNNGTLTANTAGGDLVLLNFSSNALTVNSVIANNSTASTLTKAGTGTLSLTAANTYTGGTVLNGGTVNFSGSGVLPTVQRNGAGVVSSNGVNFNGGSLVLGANNLGSPASDLTLGKLTLSGTSTLDLGATTGAPRYIVFDGFTYQGGSLTILNSAAQGSTAPTTGGRLLFSKDSFTELGSTALEGIIFQGFGGGSGTASATAVNFDANYFELVPIPEPATALGAFSLLGLVAYRERRTIRRLAKV